MGPTEPAVFSDPEDRARVDRALDAGIADMRAAASRTANGAANDVPAGVTRTAQVMSTDNIKGYDTIKLEASTCF